MKTRALLAATALILALAVTACGSGSNDPTGPDDRPTPPQEQPSGGIQAQDVKVDQTQGGLDMGPPRHLGQQRTET